MKLVILESPYAAPTPAGIEENLIYARRCLGHSLGRGEAPIASHLLYTQPGVLRDEIPAERDLGIAAGLAWLKNADLMAVYLDLGASSGMRAAMRAAVEAPFGGLPIQYRSLYSSRPIPFMPVDEALRLLAARLEKGEF